MERNRSWRRSKTDIKVINRLRRAVDKNHHYGLYDANGERIDDPIWIDLIGTDTAHMFKTYTTNKFITRYKDKWGKSGKSGYHCDYSYFTRVKHKERIKKELNNDGLKHFPTKYEPELDS